MNLIIKKEVLLENLLITSRALSSKNLIPALSGIKFDLKQDGLYLTASDNDIVIQSFIDKNKIDDIKEIGSIIIPGKYIVEIIKKIPSNLIYINKVDEYKIFIKYETGEFNINCMDSNEFPKLELNKTKNPIYLDGEKIKEIVNETVFSCSILESRPILTGLNIKINNNKLECYATDSYRLSKKIIDIKSNLNNINIVIPSKNIIELKNIINENDKEIELHIFENKVLFKKDNILFQSKLLNGNYPEVSKLIPEKFNINIKINTIDLYNVIDRASLLSNDRDKIIINLKIEKNKLIISSNTPELGKVEEYLLIENDSNLSISFISKYMLEALKSYNSKEIIISFNEEDKPFIIKNIDKKDLIQLILPIKTY